MWHGNHLLLLSNAVQVSQISTPPHQEPTPPPRPGKLRNSATLVVSFDFKRLMRGPVSQKGNANEKEQEVQFAHLKELAEDTSFSL